MKVSQRSSSSQATTSPKVARTSPPQGESSTHDKVEKRESSVGKQDFEKVRSNDWRIAKKPLRKDGDISTSDDGFQAKGELGRDFSGEKDGAKLKGGYQAKGEASASLTGQDIRANGSAGANVSYTSKDRKLTLSGDTAAKGNVSVDLSGVKARADWDTRGLLKKKLNEHTELTANADIDFGISAKVDQDGVQGGTHATGSLRGGIAHARDGYEVGVDVGVSGESRGSFSANKEGVSYSGRLGISGDIGASYREGDVEVVGRVGITFGSDIDAKLGASGRELKIGKATWGAKANLSARYKKHTGALKLVLDPKKRIQYKGVSTYAYGERVGIKLDLGPAGKLELALDSPIIGKATEAYEKAKATLGLAHKLLRTANKDLADKVDGYLSKAKDALSRWNPFNKPKVLAAS